MSMFTRTVGCCRSGVWALALFGLIAGNANASEQEWYRQIDGSTVSGVSVDAFGNAYAAGVVVNGFGGGPNPTEGYDAYLVKFNTSGDLQWRREFGTLKEDWPLGVSANSQGDAFVVGFTQGELDGPSLGLNDAFVAKYDSLGNQEWIRQFGTELADQAWGASADELGNVYVAGNTFAPFDGMNEPFRDMFLAKYDSAGEMQWTRQLGTSRPDYCLSVSNDGSGNVYIGGYTLGVLDGPGVQKEDAFLAKYDSLGDLQWITQFGSSEIDRISTVSADELGNVFVSGTTFGELGDEHFGDADAFVARFDSDGNQLWLKQVGSNGFDVSNSASADGNGNVFLAVSGVGLGSNGMDSAVVLQYDIDGNLTWERSVNWKDRVASSGPVSAFGSRFVYVGGNANLAKLNVPEPAPICLLSIASVVGTSLRCRRKPLMQGVGAAESSAAVN